MIQSHEFDLQQERKKALKEGLAEGIQQGIEQGIEEAALNNARSLRRQGILTDEQIAQALDMPVDVIKNL